jgi:opacity protein-like surface antigen
MKLEIRIALALGAAALTPLTPALAADYDPPIYVDQAPEYQPVEVGSGWYLRGDVGYAFAKSYKDTAIGIDDFLVDNNLLGNYIGLGQLGPLDAFSYKESESPITGSIGIGYHINDYLRADINVGLLANDSYRGTAHLFAGYLDPYGVANTLDFSQGIPARPDFGCLGDSTITTTTTTTTVDADGNPVKGDPTTTVQNAPDWRRDCMVSASAKNVAWNGLANGYVDLGTYSGFTPYVGAGIGLLYTRTKLTTNATCEDSSTTGITSSGGTTTETTTAFTCRGGAGDKQIASAEHSEYNFLYGLSAGVSYQLSKNTSIDVGYQYISAPNIKYYAIGDDGIEQRKGMSTNQVKVGLRYDLW